MEQNEQSTITNELVTFIERGVFSPDMIECVVDLTFEQRQELLDDVGASIAEPLSDGSSGRIQWVINHIGRESLNIVIVEQVLSTPPRVSMSDGLGPRAFTLGRHSGE